MNRMGIGAQVKLYPVGQLGKREALLGVQEINIGFGYASGQPAIAHFGLGSVTKVDVEVKLSHGKFITRTQVAADQLINLTE